LNFCVIPVTKTLASAAAAAAAAALSGAAGAAGAAGAVFEVGNLQTVSAQLEAKLNLLQN